jgi:hypothetical protein
MGSTKYLYVSHITVPLMWVHYTSTVRQPATLLSGEFMKFLKYAVLIALATIPLLMVRKEYQQQTSNANSDDIFDYELTTD